MKKRIVLKIVSLILILTIAVPSVAFAGNEKASEEIWGIFSERSTYKGMKAWYGDNASIPVVSDNPSGWLLQFRTKENSTAEKSIYVDVADGLMYDLKGEAIEIEVDYFDEGEGVFTVTYDGYEKVNDEAEFVDLTDTKKWKTHTFLIQDAVFKNRLNDADFSITVTSDFLKAANSYSGRDDIVFGAVRVKRAGVMSPIRMVVGSDATGNIFFENQKIKMNVDYTNKLKEEYNLNALVQAFDIENRLVWEDSHEISFGKEEQILRTYEFDIDRFNLYWFRVTLTDDEGKIFCIKDAEFYYVTTNYGTRLNYDLASITHVDQIGKYCEHDKVFPLYINAGYGRERLDWTWGKFKSDYKTHAVAPYMQEVLDDYKAAGVKRTIILNVEFQTHPLRVGLEYNKGAPTPQFEKDFREYVRETVRATKDYADSYIIGNEQDHASYPAEQKLPSSYVAWAKIAYETIKEEYPEALVLGYGLTMGDKPWFEETIRLGANNYFDQMSVHTYSVFKTFEEHDFVGRIQNYWDHIKKTFDIDLPPAWIGETGYFHLRHSGLSAHETSQQFPILYVYATASELVDVVCDYSMVSAGSESYGHIRGADVKGERAYDLPYAPYRDYLTIACWNKNFGGDCDFVESIDGQNTRLYKFKRRSDGKDFTAMWTVKGMENVTLDLGTNEISYMDILGNEEKMYSDDGRYTFNLSQDMKYIIGNFSKFELCEEHKYDFGVAQLDVTEGTPKEISVSIDGAKPEGYTISTTDLMKAKTSYIGKDNDALCLGVTIESPEDSFTQKYICGDVGRSQFKLYNKEIIRDIVSVDIRKDGKLYARFEVPLTEVTPISIDCDVLPKSVEQISNWQTGFTLKNEANVELAGSFRLIEPAAMAESVKPEAIRLAPGQETVLTYAVPASLVGNEVVIKAEVTLDSGDVIEYQNKKETFCAVYTDTAPTIDGSLGDTEWVLGAVGKILPVSYTQLLNTETYSGEDDLSGKVYTMWDKENLYLAVSVRDDKHKQAYTGGGTWKADGLQLGFTAGENPTTFTTFRVALNDDGTIYKQLSGSEDESNATGPVSDEDMDLVIKREEGTTTYEMRISWKLIMPLVNAVQIGDGANISGVIATDETRREAKSGETFRFSVLVNDDDGNGRKGFVEYGSGISGGSHKGFKDIILFGGSK